MNADNLNRVDIRIFFNKTGRAKYISHLDLNRFMQRALRRARIPVWHTMGFNPHPYIVFALPLSLFYESEREFMDMKLDGEMPLDEVKVRLAAQMPEGIEILSVASPTMKFTEIAFASYAVELDFDGKTKAELREMWGALTARDSVAVEKATKRNSYEIDLKEYFTSADHDIADGTVTIKTVLPAGTAGGLNPSLLAEAFKRYAAEPDFERIRRLETFDGDMRRFE